MTDLLNLWTNWMFEMANSRVIRSDYKFKVPWRLLIIWIWGTLHRGLCVLWNVNTELGVELSICSMRHLKNVFLFPVTSGFALAGRLPFSGYHKGCQRQGKLPLRGNRLLVLSVFWVRGWSRSWAPKVAAEHGQVPTDTNTHTHTLGGRWRGYKYTG